MIKTSIIHKQCWHHVRTGVGKWTIQHFALCGETKQPLEMATVWKKVGCPACLKARGKKRKRVFEIEEKP